MCISIPSTDGASETPGGLELRAPDDPLDGDEVEPAISRCVDEDLRLEGVDRVVGHQIRVEEVGSHDTWPASNAKPTKATTSRIVWATTIGVMRPHRW